MLDAVKIDEWRQARGGGIEGGGGWGKELKGWKVRRRRGGQWCQSFSNEEPSDVRRVTAAISALLQAIYTRRANWNNRPRKGTRGRHQELGNRIDPSKETNRTQSKTKHNWNLKFRREREREREKREKRKRRRKHLARIWKPRFNSWINRGNRAHFHRLWLIKFNPIIVGDECVVSIE